MKKKYIVSFLVGAAFLSCFSEPVKASETESSVVIEQKTKKATFPKLTSDKQQVTEEILAEFKEVYPDYANYKEEEVQIGRGFFSRLSSQFGFSYAKRDLPTLMYSKLAPYLSNRLSEENFLKSWDGSIQLSSSNDFKLAFTRNLKNMKVPAKLAAGTTQVVINILEEIL